MNMSAETSHMIDLEEDLPKDWEPHGFDGNKPEIRQIAPEEMEKHRGVYEARYKDMMIAMAGEAREQAVSHRQVPFKVGAAVLLATETGTYDALSSHNWTPSPAKRTGGDKRCAERNVIDTALLSDNRGLIVALTTVSAEKSTGESETNHDVLHPCQECRSLLRDLISSGHMADTSILCSVNDAGKDKGQGIIIQEKTVREILDMYPDSSHV